jgi:membrane dipeptidase
VRIVVSDTTQAANLHATAFVVDGLLTGAPSPSTVERLIKAGYDAANWTVAGHVDSMEGALKKIATFFWLRDAMPDQFRIVRSASDLQIDGVSVLRALMGFQGAEPLGNSFHSVSIFYELGVRVIQLTYNDRNLLGDGCLEPNDAGLTHFGRQIVREMNRLGMVVDLTHVGKRTSLDAMLVSSMPVVFSHSNAKAVRDNPRNLDDEQLDALAQCNGVVGVASFADFVGDTMKGQPTIEQMLDHVVYMVDRIGIDHVGIGTDIMETSGPSGIWWNANTKRRYPEICGGMDEHMHGVTGMERWEDFQSVTEGLSRRGFQDEEIGKVIGGNFQRVFSQILERSAI